MLDRAPTLDYQREWTEHFARPKPERAAGKQSLVIFRIETEWLALPTPVLQEVAESRAIHSLPHRRRGVVLGLANVRGELLICVTLGRLLGLEKQARKEKSLVIYDRLIVAHWEGRRLAFPVDEVGGIHHSREVREAPATVLKASATFTRGVLAWRNHSVGCLDEELVFANLNRNLA
jgi:chemotaxis-related protein WspD